MMKVKQNWELYQGAIEGEAMDIIQKAISEKELEPATTFNDSSTDVRSSKVAWLTEDQKVMDIIWDIASHANSIFLFNLLRQAPIQYTEYHAEDQGHYDWHHDVDWNRNDGLNRKLTVTIQLSNPEEYEGGEFEFSEVMSPPAEARKKGSVLVFPSYLQHRVKPVTKGIRKSLVAWIDGPNWV